MYKMYIFCQKKEGIRYLLTNRKNDLLRFYIKVARKMDNVYTASEWEVARERES